MAALLQAQGTAGDACTSLQASPPKVATLAAAGSVMIPVALTETRDSEHRGRARTARRFRYPEVAPEHTDRAVRAQAGTSLQTLRASATEATKTTSLGLS
jgi:hypothetical protein